MSYNAANKLHLNQLAHGFSVTKYYPPVILLFPLFGRCD